MAREVGEQLVVYVQDGAELHILDRVTAMVWRCCDGSRDEREIADLVGTHLGEHIDAGGVSARLIELATKGLVDEGAEVERVPATDDAGDPTRRQFLRRTVLAAGAAVAAPTIVTIAGGRAVALRRSGATPAVPRSAAPARAAQAPQAGAGSAEPVATGPSAGAAARGPKRRRPSPHLPEKVQTDFDLLIASLEVYGTRYAKVIADLRAAEPKLARLIRRKGRHGRGRRR